MTRPGIEPWSPELLANTLLIRPMGWSLIDVDYAYDLTFYANTPAQSEFLLHNLEQAGRGIGFYVNPDKTEFMRFKLDWSFVYKAQMF